MKGKALNFLKNTIYAVSANVSRILTTLVLTLLLPKLMSVEAYSYWQLYCFYGVYLAYSSLGLGDGLYLKYAGKSYEELDGKMMSAQFLWLCFYELIFCGAFYLICFPLIAEEYKLIALILSLCYTWIQILRYQLQMILQAANRISDYAKVYSGERFLNFGLVLACIFLGLRDFWWVAGMEVVSNILMTIYAAMLCKEKIFVKPTPLSEAWPETKELISRGFKIAMAGFTSQLIIGAVRWGIEQKWGTIAFGKISLSFSMSNMVITCITAVSIVLFPMLRNCSEELLRGIYQPMRVCLTVPLYAVLLFYAPAQLILSAWLPQYADSIRYLAVMFPLCIYETKNTVLTWTYLKTIWHEADILKANLVTLAVSAVMTVLSVFVLGNMEFAVFSIVILYAFKAIYTEVLLHKYIPVLRVKEIAYESALTVLFIFCGWKLKGIWSFAGYAAGYAVYLFLEKNEIRTSMREIKGYLKKE